MATDDKTCDLCGDVTAAMFLHARCHPTAPLMAKKEGNVLVLSCYVPECAREVVRFEIAEPARETTGDRPRHNHIDLPRGFYAMLCHPSGAPGSEWDRAARLIEEAPAMHRLLRRFVDHLQSWKVEETAGGEMADARVLLKRIG